MKRTILILLALASLTVVVVVGFQAVEMDGAPRLLVIAGAVILLVGSIDGLRRPSLASDAGETGAGETGAGETDSNETDSNETVTSTPATSTEAVAVEAHRAPAAVVATSKPASTVIGLREPTTTIDLRDGASAALVPRDGLVDQLIADGLLRVVDAPISDDEVHAMVMVAVIQGALPELRPRLRALKGDAAPSPALAALAS